MTENADWQGIHERLERLQREIETGWQPTPEEKKNILKKRAELLAHEQKSHAEEGIEILEFVIGEERFGVEPGFVREVHPLKELAFIPCTPPYVLGIINVRGEIVSVLDLGSLFDEPHGPPAGGNKVIILEDEGFETGILVDEVFGVKQVPKGEIEPSLPTLTGVRQDYLKGVSREQTTILDAKALLSDGKLVVREEVR